MNGLLAVRWDKSGPKKKPRLRESASRASRDDKANIAIRNFAAAHRGTKVLACAAAEIRANVTAMNRPSAFRPAFVCLARPAVR
jgi:hypothetical protein